MTRRIGVIVWLAVTIALFMAPFQGPEIKVYSQSNADGSGREVFITLLGALAVTTFIPGIVALTVAWIRARRAKRATAAI